MEEIIYKVPLIKQGIQECVQSSATQLLQFKNVEITLETVAKELPTYTTSDGVNLGTSLGHLGLYFLHKGFETTIHTADIEMFDRSWQDKSQVELAQLLKQRLRNLPHARYPREVIELMTEGYIEFINSGGNITICLFDEKYLYDLLVNGPFVLVLNYNMLNEVSKYGQVDSKPVKDDIQGKPSAHAVVIVGYKDGDFLLLDPDYEFGGERWVSSSRIIAALYLAEIDLALLAITIK